MKKIIVFVVMVIMMLNLSACTKKETDNKADKIDSSSASTNKDNTDDAKGEDANESSSDSTENENTSEDGNADIIGSEETAPDNGVNPELNADGSPIVKPGDAQPVAPDSSSVTTETKPEAKPETKPETKPEVKPSQTPSAKPETKPETKPEVKPSQTPSAKPETKPEVKPETKPESESKDDAQDNKTLGNKLLSEFNSVAGSGNALSIAEKLAASSLVSEISLVSADVEPGYLAGFDNTEITGFKEGATFCPMISTQPFVGYVFVLEDGGDVKGFISKLKSAANLRWNVCSAAEEVVVGSSGNKVFFVMCPKSL